MWYLVWILVIRSGSDFFITPNERVVGSLKDCRKQTIVLEQQFHDNPVDWGDATSYSIRCEFRE